MWNLLNTGNGVSPLKVDTAAMLNNADAGDDGPGGARTSKKSADSLPRSALWRCLRRRTQHSDDRASRLGQDHAGQAFPGILPPLAFEEALETTKIHSVAGVLDATAGLVSARPFRFAAPYHL